MKIHTFKNMILTGLVIFSLSFSGCKSNQELDTYKANMNQFFENIKVYDSSINAIDPESETAVSELLTLLDSMDISFTQMASLEVPDDFPGVEGLADEASEYMTEAVSYYHQAFEADPFDSSLADVAKQYYDRANVRIQYIVSILHGEIPEDAYTYEEESSEMTESEETTELSEELDTENISETE